MALCSQCNQPIDRPQRPRGPRLKLCSRCAELGPRKRYDKWAEKNRKSAKTIRDCQRCGKPIDRTYTRGPALKFCSVCSVERKHERWREWAARDVNRVARNRYQQNGREKFALKNKLTKYKITAEEYEVLPKKCAVCGSTKDLCFDHDHLTGLFRGLLCRVHNRVLGQLNDDPAEILALYRYIASAPEGKPLDLNPVACGCGCGKMMPVLDTRGVPMISLPGHAPRKKKN